MMMVKYVCRHCRSSLGEIRQQDVSEQQLGFQFLTPEERSDIIAYNHQGHTIVKVICDYCNEAFHANPELFLLASPLQ
jgi:hypothetical protein